MKLPSTLKEEEHMKKYNDAPGTPSWMRLLFELESLGEYERTAKDASYEITDLNHSIDVLHEQSREHPEVMADPLNNLRDSRTHQRQIHDEACIEAGVVRRRIKSWLTPEGLRLALSILRITPIWTDVKDTGAVVVPMDDGTLRTVKGSWFKLGYETMQAELRDHASRDGRTWT